MSVKPCRVNEYVCRRYFGVSYKEMVEASKKQYPDKIRQWHNHRVGMMVKQAVKEPPPPPKSLPRRLWLCPEERFFDKIVSKERLTI